MAKETQSIARVIDDAAEKVDRPTAVEDDLELESIVEEREPGQFKNLCVGLAFASPYIVLWFLFMVYPIGYGFFISLHEWNPIIGSKFIGLDNYAGLLTRERFWNSFVVTLEYSAYAVSMIMFLGLAFALILKAVRIFGKTFIEASLFFPYLLNVSVISILWMFLLDPDVGIVRYYLRAVGIDAPNFLDSPVWVIFTVAFVTAWWLAGYRMVVFRAGLETIPEELYESASLDGAGRFRSLFSITLPLLKPTLLFTLVITLVGGMRNVGQVMIMTEGGPGHSSEVLALYMYRLGFLFFKFGEAAAVGFIIFVVILVISAILFKLLGTSSELR